MKTLFSLVSLVSVMFVTEAALAQRSSQVIVVRQNANPGTPFSATIELRELGTTGLWEVTAGPYDAVIGRNGFAARGKKREGDGKTPSGSFLLGTVFGYEERPAFELKMPYRQATDQDYWVDDVASPQYNQWVHGTPNATSWEVMRRSDDLYSIGAVIEYNTNPVFAGRGSAIFLHVWRGPGHATAGCVALAKESLETILSRLDRHQYPIISINPVSYGENNN